LLTNPSVASETLENKRWQCIMNQLDPIEELYDMYSDKEKTLRIVEIAGDDLYFDLDIENRLADLYLKL